MGQGWVDGFTGTAVRSRGPRGTQLCQARPTATRMEPDPAPDGLRLDQTPGSLMPSQHTAVFVTYFSGTSSPASCLLCAEVG